MGKMSKCIGATNSKNNFYCWMDSGQTFLSCQVTENNSPLAYKM